MPAKNYVGSQPEQANSPMWEYLQQEEFDYQRPERGEIRNGIILRHTSSELIIDIGVKLDVIVPSSDYEKMEDVDRLHVGLELPVLVVSIEEDKGRIVGSVSQAKVQEDWEEAERHMETGDIYDTMIAGHNKGGLIVPFGRLRGFVPTSQVVSLGIVLENGQKIERLEQLMGKKIKVKVIEVNQKRKRLIMSERAAMKEWRAENKTRLLDELKEGDVRKGMVTNLMNFGAFIDLGGADGLIHVSELAWNRVKHPKDVLTIGQEVEVYVLSVDRNDERIALSMKRLQQDPWQAATAKYQIGDVVEGEITNLTDFGAFARIDDSIEGLIHVSELSDDKVEHPREVVHRGQRVTVRIISIDGERQRIGLSLKRVPQPFEEGGDAQPEATATDTTQPSADDTQAAPDTAQPSADDTEAPAPDTAQPSADDTEAPAPDMTQLSADDTEAPVDVEQPAEESTTPPEAAANTPEESTMPSEATAETPEESTMPSEATAETPEESITPTAEE